jgi:hypothetical protein
MKVSVRIESNLKKMGALGPPMEIELKKDRNTLEDVLERLSARYSDLRLLKDGKASDDLCQLLLNGESYLSFPEGLKRSVNEGDTILVDVYIDILSGG